MADTPGAMATAGTSADGGAQPMTKNQMKKQAKLQRIQEAHQKRKEDKKARKQAQQAAKASAKGSANAQKAPLTPEEKQAKEEKRREALARLDAKKKEKAESLARVQRAQASGIKVAIDLDFFGVMEPKEHRSLVQQLSYSYSSNTHAAVPCSLHFTSYCGELKELLMKQFPGHLQWAVGLHEAPFLEAFGADARSRIVYLTADSPHELDVLAPDAIYIVGGLVDRNRHKNLCLDRARAAGVNTARLPIGGHLKLAGSKVLAVNHVVALLLSYLEKQDWKAACESVIPVRKQDDKRKADEGGANEHAPKQDDHKRKAGDGDNAAPAGAQAGAGAAAEPAAKRQKHEGAPGSAAAPAEAAAAAAGASAETPAAAAAPAPAGPAYAAAEGSDAAGMAPAAAPGQDAAADGVSAADVAAAQAPPNAQASNQPAAAELAQDGAAAAAAGGADAPSATEAAATSEAAAG